MKIVVFETTKLDRKKLKDILVSIEINLDLEFTVIFSKNKEEILELNRIDSCVVNIIDVTDKTEGTVNGIELAKEIKRVNRTQFVLFIAAEEGDLKESVYSNVEPLGYYAKTNENVNGCILTAFKKIISIKEASTTNVRLKFKDEDKELRYLSLDDIYLFKTSPLRQKYMIVETYHDSFLVKGSIHKYENVYSQLVRCNKSTLVNKTKISKISKGTNPKNSIIHFDGPIENRITKCLLSVKYKNNVV